MIMTITVLYGISYSTLRVLFAVNGSFSPTEQAFYIPTFSVKLLLDFYMIAVFISCITFFLRKKLAAMKKGAHSIGFSRLNYFILYSICFLVFMRITGAIYTFAVGVISLTPLFQNPEQKLSYEILDDLIFPIRDFIEILFFAYLFYFQSKKKRDLAQVNQRWTEAAKLPAEERVRSPLIRSKVNKNSSSVKSGLENVGSLLKDEALNVQ